MQKSHARISRSGLCPATIPNIFKVGKRPYFRYERLPNRPYHAVNGGGTFDLSYFRGYNKMATKSSRKTSKIPSKKQTRIPTKWRNLPAAESGITPTMKARPIINTVVGEIMGGEQDFMHELMPISIEAFMAEHTALVIAGYHTFSVETSGRGVCEICGGKGLVGFTYTQRHRNGKPDTSGERFFNLCPECLYVGEWFIVTEDRTQGTSPNDPAA